MCDARLIDVTGAPTDKLMAANPFYRVAIIPGAVKACEEPGLKKLRRGAAAGPSEAAPVQH